MKDIPDESVDLIVTDPPYKTTKRGKIGGGGRKKVGGMLVGDGQFFERQFNIHISDWMPQLYRCLKSGSHVYVFTNALNLTEMLNEAQRCGFKLQNLLVWQKNNCTPSQYYMKNCEYVLLLRKGRAKWINNQGSKTVHQFSNVIGEKIHPTEKPVELIQFYIENSSSRDDIVLDPFMGSCPAGIACLNTGRNFIGIELDEKYFGIAKDRIENHQVT